VEEGEPFKHMMELYHARESHLQEPHAAQLWKEAGTEVIEEANAVKMWV
jgi:hypothetical protein